MAKALLDGEPRIALFAARGDGPSQTGVSITPYMLAEGDAVVIADRLHTALSAPPSPRPVNPPAATADVTGTWDVRIQYAASTSTHRLSLRQRGSDVDGAHQGDFVGRDVSGSVSGDAVTLHSAYEESHGDALGFTFAGTVSGETMTGTLDMGEYLSATWTAQRRGGARG